MRTYKEEEKTTKIATLVNITCDKCKKVIEIIHDDCMKGTNFRIDAGYGSRFDFALSDGNTYLDICDDCTAEFLAQCGLDK